MVTYVSKSILDPEGESSWTELKVIVNSHGFSPQCNLCHHFKIKLYTIRIVGSSWRTSWNSLCVLLCWPLLAQHPSIKKSKKPGLKLSIKEGLSGIFLNPSQWNIHSSKLKEGICSIFLLKPQAKWKKSLCVCPA